jgi:hypothetical protein
MKQSINFANLYVGESLGVTFPEKYEALSEINEDCHNLLSKHKVLFVCILNFLILK